MRLYDHFREGFLGPWVLSDMVGAAGRDDTFKMLRGRRVDFGAHLLGQWERSGS